MWEEPGTAPLTRDGGFKMINRAIREFEIDTFVPALANITKQITANDHKTDEIFLMVARMKGAIWAVGLMLAAPSFIISAIDIWKQVHS